MENRVNLRELFEMAIRDNDQVEFYLFDNPKSKKQIENNEENTNLIGAIFWLDFTFPFNDIAFDDNGKRYYCLEEEHMKHLLNKMDEKGL